MTFSHLELAGIVIVTLLGGWGTGFSFGWFYGVKETEKRWSDVVRKK